MTPAAVTPAASAPAGEGSPSGLSSAGRIRRVVDAAERWVSRPWVSYLAVFLVQLKVVWGAWRYRDLTGGADTASYFTYAEHWVRQGVLEFAWSPLYTVFYGSLLGLTPGDAYLPTIAHRLLIVFAVTLLLLGVMRRLLPPGLALLVAFWWAIVPITFETAFEVHLFATVPVFTCWLAILGGKGPGYRGAALAILTVGAVLVRNELLPAVLLLATICAAAEFRARRAAPPGSATRGGRYVVAYGLPMLLAAAVCAAVYARELRPFAQLVADSPLKHTANMCQVYTFGYKQRHPEVTLDHWTECGLLMREHFGKALPTLGEMLRRNPRAVVTHFAWNASLTGGGLQMLLFNCMSGDVTPDYGPVPRSKDAAWLSILAGAVFMAGVVAVFRGRRRGLDPWLVDRAWGWLAIFAMVPSWIAVILTQRPRPAYLLALGAAAMAALATSLFLTVWRPVTRVLGRGGIWVLVALVAALLRWYPSYYPPAERPLLTLYRRHLPFEVLIARPDTVLLTSSRPFELYLYVGRGQPRVLQYGQALAHAGGLERFLEESHVNMFYADESMLETMRRSGRFDSLLHSLRAGEWTLIGGQEIEGARWRLWHRPAVSDAGSTMQITPELTGTK